MRHLSEDSIELTTIIRERNENIKKGFYEVIDLGIHSFGDTYIIASSKEDAIMGKEWLKEASDRFYSVENVIKKEVECEKKFDLQIWSSTDFNITELQKRL